MAEEVTQNCEKALAMLRLEDDERQMELAKEGFMTIMEAVWPAVATYYFEVEREIFSSIKNIAANSKFKDLKIDKRSQEIQVEILKNDVRNEAVVGSSGVDANGSLNLESRTSSRKIVQIKGENGKITWDVADDSSPLSNCAKDAEKSDNDLPPSMELKRSEPILAPRDHPSSIFCEPPKDIPANLRQLITDTESRIREILSVCFSKISKSIIGSYPRIRLAISKAYPQLRHGVGCSYPNIQSTINSAYDKVQGTAKSSYPKIRKTVSSTYPKRQTVTLCYRKYRQHKNGGRIDAAMGAKLFSEANQEMGNQLAGANTQISQALHNVSKKISVALGGANLEVLQAVKVASTRVSKALVKANSEILEALAGANDDLRKSVALAYNEASRGLEAVKTDLSENLLDLPSIVPRTVLHAFQRLQGALAECHVELLQTLAKAGAEVCEQITYAHGKYSEAKVNVNYDISMALAKANSQVLQILIGANSKVGDILERNCERFRVSISAFKPGSNPEFLENKVWRLLERNEGEVWRATDTASGTIESAIESTDGHLWKIADEADNSLKKTVQVVEQKLLTIIASSEWKLKASAEQLEQLVMENVVKLRETSWQVIATYADDYVPKNRSKLFSRSKQCPGFELSLYELHRSASIEVILRYDNDYFVGFPDSEEDEDLKSGKRALQQKPSQMKISNSGGDSVRKPADDAPPEPKTQPGGQDFVKVHEISSDEAVQLSRCSACTNIASSLHDIPELPFESCTEVRHGSQDSEVWRTTFTRPSESNMTEPFEDDRAAESSLEDIEPPDEYDKLSEISDFAVNASKISLPDLGDPSQYPAGISDESFDEPATKRRRCSEEAEDAILPSLKKSLVQCAEEILGLSSEPNYEFDLHHASSGYNICREIVHEEVRGTFVLEESCHGNGKLPHEGNCVKSLQTFGDTFNADGATVGLASDDPEIKNVVEDGSSSFWDKLSPPEKSSELPPLLPVQSIHTHTCNDETQAPTSHTQIDSFTEMDDNWEPPEFRHVPSSNPNEPVTLRKLTAIFRENMQKLQQTLSGTSLNNVETTNSATDAFQILQECQSAWDALTMLHGAACLSPKVSAAELPPPMEAETVPKDDLECKKSDESTEFSTEHGSLDEEVRPKTFKHLSRDSLLEAEDVFSTIHWEIIESVTGEAPRDDKNLYTEACPYRGTPPSASGATCSATKSQVSVASASEMNKKDGSVSEISIIPNDFAAVTNETETTRDILTLSHPTVDDKSIKSEHSKSSQSISKCPASAGGHDSSNLVVEIPADPSASQPIEPKKLKEMVSDFVELSSILFYSAPLTKTVVASVPSADQIQKPNKKASFHNLIAGRRAKVITRTKNLAERVRRRILGLRGANLKSSVKKLLPCLQIRHKYSSKVNTKNLRRFSTRVSSLCRARTS